VVLCYIDAAAGRLSDRADSKLQVSPVQVSSWTKWNLPKFRMRAGEAGFEAAHGFLRPRRTVNNSSGSLEGPPSASAKAACKLLYCFCERRAPSALAAAVPLCPIAWQLSRSDQPRCNAAPAVRTEASGPSFFANIDTATPVGVRLASLQPKKPCRRALREGMALCWTGHRRDTNGT
jgi:hypothetical protein